MILTKLRCEPTGLFDEVPFKRGVNFIFWKKAVDDPKKSLNGIGKSLLLDIVDFCLWSNLSERLKMCQKNVEIWLGGYSAVLEFKIQNNDYIIKRSFGKTEEVEITTRWEAKSYKVSEARSILCDLIFLDDSYRWKYYNIWFRKLLPFFVKIQSPKKDTFSDPLTYIQGIKPMELLQFHMFFLWIDNTLSFKNFEIGSQLKLKKNALTEIQSFIEESYGLTDITEAAGEFDKANKEVRELENAIQSFKLAEQYADAETTSNELTTKIKTLLLENYEDELKLKTYSESSSLQIDFDVRQISKIYSELNEILGQKIQKSLEDAISFRKAIVASRHWFLSEEIRRLENVISQRNTALKSIEEERATIFRFLNSKDAIKDLSEAYLRLSKKREQINELSWKIGLYTDLLKEQAELKAESANLYADIVKFIANIKGTESEIRSVFSEIYNSIYSDFKDQSNFAITANERKDQKIDITINFPSGLSKWKNHGRTLIYDLTVLIRAIEAKRNFPRFLIQDGIFDGVDRWHLVHLYKYLQELSGKYDFQYILTLNEEWILNDENFGAWAQELTSEKIESEAIIVLTPDKKLFWKDF